ncbi:hypothetical protein Cadr_000008746 [Camelus dromedarius]|uniref:Uncharacterized protein n=1 Tax=Camelus dromedarius TaxID=9838 RepID=A0A5N4DZN7_CAMDR|nr:hypothetical protein Cadr_000008746 [Camelus dromedarius]
MSQASSSSNFGEKPGAQLGGTGLADVHGPRGARATTVPGELGWINLGLVVFAKPQREQENPSSGCQSFQFPDDAKTLERGDPLGNAGSHVQSLRGAWTFSLTHDLDLSAPLTSGVQLIQLLKTAAALQKQDVTTTCMTRAPVGPEKPDMGGRRRQSIRVGQDPNIPQIRSSSNSAPSPGLCVIPRMSASLGMETPLGCRSACSRPAPPSQYQHPGMGGGQGPTSQEGGADFRGVGTHGDSTPTPESQALRMFISVCSLHFFLLVVTSVSEDPRSCWGCPPLTAVCADLWSILPPGAQPPGGRGPVLSTCGPRAPGTLHTLHRQPREVLVGPTWLVRSRVTAVGLSGLREQHRSLLTHVAQTYLSQGPGKPGVVPLLRGVYTSLGPPVRAVPLTLGEQQTRGLRAGAGLLEGDLPDLPNRGAVIAAPTIFLRVRASQPPLQASRGLPLVCPLPGGMTVPGAWCRGPAVLSYGLGVPKCRVVLLPPAQLPRPLIPGVPGPHPAALGAPGLLVFRYRGLVFTTVCRRAAPVCAVKPDLEGTGSRLPRSGFPGKIEWGHRETSARPLPWEQKGQATLGLFVSVGRRVTLNWGQIGEEFEGSKIQQGAAENLRRRWRVELVRPFGEPGARTG